MIRLAEMMTGIADLGMGKPDRIPVVYTVERAKEVRRRVRDEGERITAVCADLEMNFENFLRWCRRNNFKVHSRASKAKSRALPRGPYPLGEKVDPVRKPRSGGRASAIVDDWREGKLAPTEIAIKHGVGYVYVVRLRKLAGLNPPAGKGRNIKNPNHERETTKQPNSTVRNRQIMKELADGESVAEIARRYGRSRSGIYNIRKKMNAE